MSDLLITLVALLDTAPAPFRGLIFGTVLALLLPPIVQRLPLEHPGMVASGGRAALVLLLLGPILAALVPVRWAVPVERAPSLEPVPWLLWALLGGLWVAGAVRRGRREAQAARSTRRRLGAAQPVPDGLAQRGLHWHRRLGLRRPVALRVGPVERAAAVGVRRPLVVLPRAWVHWPAPVRDAACIQTLASMGAGITFWRAAARLAGTLHWFVPGVPRIGVRLGEALLRVADEHALGVTKDALGYRRALRHVADRLAGRPGPDLESAVLWGDPAALRERAERVGDRYYTDPAHGRVYWVLAPAVLLAFAVAGGTIHVRQPEDAPDVIVFRNDWHGLFRPGSYEGPPGGDEGAQ